MKTKQKSSAWRIVLIALLCMVIFFACNLDQEPTDNIIPNGVDEKGIRYAGGGTIPKPERNTEYFILKSRTDRDEFIDLFKTIFAEDPDVIINDRFLGLNTYIDTFFNEFNLLIIPRYEGSRSIRHKVEKIALQDSVLFIRIARILPEVGLLVPKFVYILIPVKKDYFNGEEVKIEFRDTKDKK